MAADAQSSNWTKLQLINPDDLEIEKPLASANNISKIISPRYCFDLSASQLPGIFENCSNSNESFSPSYLKNPQPMILPRCEFYPTEPESRSRLFCCRAYSQVPIQFFLKSVIETIYHTVLDMDFSFTDMHCEVHKKLHRVIDGMLKNLETTGLRKLFERVAVTIADGRASDIIIDHGLNPENNSYSNAAGEYVLSESLLKDTFSFQETTDGVHFSSLQPVTPYFLQLIYKHSAADPENRILLEEVPGNDCLFMIRTNLKNNRAYLPLVYCIGMLFGCPFDGMIPSQYWIFKKEVLYLFAKIFGILDVNMSGILYIMLTDDIHRRSKQQKIFCRPLWRALISIERTPSEAECRSHIPRTAVTAVELSRFAEIFARSETLVGYEKEDIEREKPRVLNMYENRENGRVRDECITAILMYERKQLREERPQFIPKLKWIHKRRRLVKWIDENASEDY